MDKMMPVHHISKNMKKDIIIRDKTITVLFHYNSIGIISNEGIFELVKKLPEDAMEEFISVVKKEYYDNYNKDFDVSDDSITIEIWGHVFAEQFADAIKSLTNIKLIDNLAEKINAHCAIINIGEREHDNNRFVWDGLAAFKPAIKALLF